MGISLDSNNKEHRITAPKKGMYELKKQYEEYNDPQKVMGYSRKKRKIVMKYPRRTYWRKYWAKRNKKK